MTPDPGPRPVRPRPRGSGDGWVDCGCGARHWGLHGAAGVVVADAWPATRIVLQLRADWSHFGGTWGVPGGAIHADETPVVGGLREAEEESGVIAAHLRVFATTALHHPDWSYTTALARLTAPVDPRPTDDESAAIEWVDVDAVADLPLHPAFADAWPRLRPLLTRRVVLVVDAANVVGSRPDGWWKDRHGATERLRDELAARTETGFPAAALGLPADTWSPDVVLVTEGAARDVGPVDAVSVVAAPGSGDDEIVAQVAALTNDQQAQVIVATADRGLIGRVTALGAAVVGPRTVRD
ncbi:NUDIX domain-containing protein [Propionibacteriaceae bacterium Y2011]|uniref:NUDIX domain-containing protein n=1 Tax=Microlunatus sp. Y2014 TaxID=3418488 RepID=UPI003B4C1477